jgi:hypothetical protein
MSTQTSSTGESHKSQTKIRKTWDFRPTSRIHGAGKTSKRPKYNRKYDGNNEVQ